MLFGSKDPRFCEDALQIADEPGRRPEDGRSLRDLLEAAERFPQKRVTHHIVIRPQFILGSPAAEAHPVRGLVMVDLEVRKGLGGPPLHPRRDESDAVFVPTGDVAANLAETVDAKTL